MEVVFVRVANKGVKEDFIEVRDPQFIGIWDHLTILILL